MTEIGLFSTNLSNTAPSIGGLLQDKIEESPSYTISSHLYTTGSSTVSDHGVPRRRGSANHLICLEEDGWGNGEAEGLGCLEVDDQLELHRLLHRQVGGFRPLEDAIHVVGGAAEEVRQVRSIGHQTASHDPYPAGKHARQVLLGGELRDVLSVHIDERIPQDEERIRACLGRAGERAFEVLRAAHFLRVEQEAQRAGRRLRLLPRRRVGGIRRSPEDHHARESGNDVGEWRSRVQVADPVDLARRLRLSGERCHKDTEGENNNDPYGTAPHDRLLYQLTDLPATLMEAKPLMRIPFCSLPALPGRHNNG